MTIQKLIKQLLVMPQDHLVVLSQNHRDRRGWVVKLPDKLSDLIDVALIDFAKIKKDPRYSVDMGDWHAPIWDSVQGDETCAVCFAGAVMAKSLNADPNKEYSFTDFEGNCRKLRALDYARRGQIRKALIRMGQLVPTHLENLHVPEYEDNPEAFRATMQGMANGLREAEL